ncbi:MAG: hypothetical protein A2033_09185 [Bacteroidetes bacterium GWA2_31_9]|nr:MAG: hypothetical protein A2033_09185 [Bacteroidetes bacterium GWA2_31_9]
MGEDIFEVHLSGIDLFKYCYKLFNAIPFVFEIENDISAEDSLKKLNEFCGKDLSENIVYKTYKFKEGGNSEIEYKSCLIKYSEDIVIFYQYDEHSILFKPGTDEDLIKNIASIIHSCSPKKDFRNNFHMVHYDDGYFLQDFEIKNKEICLETNYNDDIKQVVSVTDAFIENKYKTGLLLFHGVPGTGKTTFIRYLISKYNTRFLYLPLNMVSNFTGPQFLPFISRYQGSVIVIEDCEDLLKSREANQVTITALADILNLADGILGDALSLKIICTFNANVKDIDKALLRKGRLILKYEFKELEAEKATELSHNLGYNVKYSKPVTLAEIYNQEVNNLSPIDEKRIGF